MFSWVIPGKKWRWFLFAAALAGLIISGYLLQAYVSNRPVICGQSGGCEVVRLSRYAAWYGVPTPALGALFYLSLAGAAALMPMAWSKGKILLMLMTAAGIAVSAGLSYIEAFVLHSWCRWCIGSAVVSVLTFMLTWVILPDYDK